MSIIKKEKRGKKGGGGGIKRNVKKNDNAEAGIFSPPRVTAMAFVRKTFSVRRWFALEMNRVCACIGNE